MSYNVFQQVFGLSLASNAAKELKGTQEALQAALQKELPHLIALVGEWKVFWGPVIWKADPSSSDTGPDNAWYVAKNPAVVFEDGTVRDTYVMAVAGSATTYNWTHDNFMIQNVIDFLGWVAAGVKTPPKQAEVKSGGTYIAFGTGEATHTLLSYPAPKGAAGEGITLYDFMSGLSPSPGSKVIFTGHSLGGALSPTVALGLVKSGALKPTEVLAYPTAGPSPGNKGFANLFAETFPKTAGSGYQIWNCNIINTLDIVSQAWCTKPKESPAQNLDNIPPIYGLPVILAVYWAVFMFKGWANLSKTIYIPLQASAFSGTHPEATPDDIKKFIAVAGEEHTKAFFNFFGVHPPPAKLLIEDGISGMTEEEKYLTYPIICDLEWGVIHPIEGDAAIAVAEARKGSGAEDKEPLA